MGRRPAGAPVRDGRPLLDATRELEQEVQAGECDLAEGTAGGAVLSPVTGLHERVLVFDFKSLYPSLMRTFEIDPWNLVRPEEGVSDPDPIVAPSGGAFGTSARRHSATATRAPTYPGSTSSSSPTTAPSAASTWRVARS